MRRIAAVLLTIVLTASIQVSTVFAETLSTGAFVSFGHYNDEPILWQIIHINDDGSALLWSDKVLTVKAYDAKGDTVDGRGGTGRIRVGSNFWAKSSLREWLNSDEQQVTFSGNPPSPQNLWEGLNSYDKEPGFLTNFTPEERALIKPVDNKSVLANADLELKTGGTTQFMIMPSRDVQKATNNHRSAYYHTVTDKVFILDLQQLADYVDSNDFDVTRQPTAVAVEKSDHKSPLLAAGRNFLYWTRTPVTETDYLIIKISEQGVPGEWSVDNRNLGIVPALYVTDVKPVSGSGSKNDPYLIASSSRPPEADSDSVGQAVSHPADSKYRASVSPRASEAEMRQFADLALKWAYGGSPEKKIENGWYSTPAIADLDGNGRLEIIAASYSIVNVDAETGELNWRIGSGYDRSNSVNGRYKGRTYPDVILKDIDGDGLKEIVTAHGAGYISVYDNNGYFKPGWPQKPMDGEFRSLKVADLDLDGKMEIIAATSLETAQNVYVYSHDGKLRPGWPQLEPSKDGEFVKGDVLNTSFAWAVFNNNLSVGDLTGDGYPDIIVPSDVPFICAYDRNGNLIKAGDIYGGRKWGQVGFWEDMAKENRMENEGWGYYVEFDAPPSEKNTFNFSHNGSVIYDVDGDGKNEVIVTGNLHDISIGAGESLRTTLLILNNDRTRFKSSEYDWQVLPEGSGPPLIEDYNILEYVMPIPVVTDLDGDGKVEILFSSYDGRLNCYWLDKEQKHAWPFDVYKAGAKTYEHSSTPTAADLNGDGRKEIIFTTWTEKESGINGRLIILNYKGELLNEIELPKSKSTPYTNGCLAAPLIYDIDGDESFEIILNTVYSGVAIYETNVVK